MSEPEVPAEQVPTDFGQQMVYSGGSSPAEAFFWAMVALVVVLALTGRLA